MNSIEYLSLPTFRNQLNKRLVWLLVPIYLVLSVQSVLKYPDHAWLYWIWILLATLPLFFLTFPYFKSAKIKHEYIPLSQAIGIKRFGTFYLILILLTLVPGETLAYVYAQIGYVNFFNMMRWPIGLAGLLLMGILSFIFVIQPRLHQQIPKMNLTQSLAPTIQISEETQQFTHQSILEATRALIRKNEIDRVFDYLHDQTEENLYLDQLAVLEGRYRSLQDTWKDNRVERSKAQIELNQIAYALIQLAKEMMSLESF